MTGLSRTTVAVPWREMKRAFIRLLSERRLIEGVFGGKCSYRPISNYEAIQRDLDEFYQWSVG